ncbi:conserved hypothetical protein [Talaromyces stipitatus ATCC 10500]|uniref:MOZ protein represents a chromatin-associated acetyltransferase n=1 Tax=Talaromyces stipitatus (strain ATCC 10500 / CBS 375.48 / QM 6759 / NRRL 1006) TaxID=441959 RepID=B8M6C9_TALSN|nr:uncharacterized protein TSTA_026150 [Talaromyces stipitatus ATCC 10500]EED19304.1 conserved hypothetical protein [Talaromyces stipitatus ATCC 10500]
MAAPRLPFLYPQLFRSVGTYETGARSLRFTTFTVTRHRNQSTVTRRQPQSIESKLPPPTQPKKRSARQSSSSSLNRNTNPKAQKDNTRGDSEQPSQDIKDGNKEDATKSTKSSEPSTQLLDKNEVPCGASKNSVDPAQMPREVPPPKNPMDAVLQMPPPSDLGLARLHSNGQEVPHLEPAPYIHHFDTYTLVKNLQEGGFSEEQAITLMKGIRGILQEKLDLAERTLTSKSDSENEEYLFKAACSELRSSLEASRHLEVERQRSSRTQLQHEVDILNMRITQELAKMNDDLKGMWNEHKMTTREQQQGQDTGIQELNYKIAVSLASDGKSEAEGLRWVLTRRAAFAIVFSAMMAITFLKFWSARSHELERRQAAAKEIAKLETVKDAAVQTEPSLSDTLASETLG